MPKYGAIKDGELITSDHMLQGYKPIKYEDLPLDFNQETHFVTQAKPIDDDEYIYVGIELHELDLEGEDVEGDLF